jgi:ADP-ribosylglycohydrolase
MTAPVVENRALAAYLGFAIGDALGATVEFMTKREVAAQYGVHREIVGGGWLKLAPGQVTDDTEMALALGRSIIRTGGLDARDVLLHHDLGTSSFEECVVQTVNQGGDTDTTGAISTQVPLLLAMSQGAGGNGV